jgi:hypothetical protein
MKNLLFLTFFLVLQGQLAAQQAPVYVGIPSEQMNYFSASQQQSQWCWAASIQMVFNYYGVGIDQDQIVRRTYGMDPYGNLPNWPGSFQAIHSNLNNWSIDNYGNRYTVTASIGMGAPAPAILLRELAEGRPVILGYQTGPNSGHAVVATAASYIQTPMGPQIQTIVVRDPWPSRDNLQTMGRQEWPGIVLANRIQAYWYVRVFR